MRYNNFSGKFRRHFVSCFWKRTLVAGFLCALGSSVVMGSVTGSISGTVKDSSGAVIPVATVTALNSLTGVKWTVNTDGKGFYSFTALPVGRYEVDVSHSGFKRYVQTGLVIDVNTALRVDVTLQVGVTTQAVTVSSTAVQVQTASTQMGEVIGSTKMLTLPLNGRSYTDLLALQPGVVPSTTGLTNGFVSVAPSGGLDSGNLSISGGRETANGFMVNGGNAQEGIQMGTAIVPNLDSIAEFRILTNNFDAEYGNYSGGQVNVVTKSGTNHFHGDAFEFLRNTSLDARNFYSASRGAFHQNQFGGTIGGPIIHDRAFFFGDYQGTRQIVGSDTGRIPVPSAADRTGNLADSSGNLIGKVTGTGFASTLSQELGYPVTAGEPFYTSGCASSAQCVFPNAVIPQRVWSPPAAHLMQYIPTANVPGGFFSTSAFNQTLRDDKWSARIDGNTRWGLISGYYFFDNFRLNNPYPSASVPGFSGIDNGRAQMFNVGGTKSFGSSAVNEFRLNYLRNVQVGPLPEGGVGTSLSSLGFVTGCSTLGICVQNPKYEGVPNIGFNNFTIGVPGFFAGVFENTFQALDNYSKVAGTHTLKFGADFHYDQVTEHDSGGNNGTFGFNGSAETGLDFADFLLGAPNSFQQGFQLPLYSRARYLGLYGQDSWRVRPNLTFNYGLRWEVITPWYERDNELETMVPGLQSATFPGAPKGWVFPGDPGIPRTVAPIRYDNFAPRVGLAYSPNFQGHLLRMLTGGTGKTSARLGFGKFYTGIEDIVSIQVVGDAPFGFFWSSPTPPMFATPYVDLYTGNVEGQRFPIAAPPLNASPAHPDNNINWAQFIPISSSPGYFYRNRTPYTEEYMASLQRQFGANTVLSLSYVGTQGHRLLVDLEANPSIPALCLQAAAAGCGPFSETGSFTLPSGQVIVPRARLGTAFGSNGWYAHAGNSDYNALEISVHHSSGRSTFLAGYTYSKSMDQASALNEQINPFNPGLSKALSAFDVTHNFVASYSYELPFDKLLRPNRLTQGWIVSGVSRFSTGFPITIGENDDHALIGDTSTGPNSNTVDEPIFTPGTLLLQSNPRKGGLYFNTALFRQEPIGQLGNSTRRFFHGPGINNWDIALVKNLRLTESKTLEFRGEFFNIFNHAQFNNPSGNILNPSFGVVTSANAPRIAQLAVKFLF